MASPFQAWAGSPAQAVPPWLEQPHRQLTEAGALQNAALGWPRRLSRKDATAFVRAVKRWGRADRIAAICDESGAVLPALDQGPQLALWHGLLRGCDKVQSPGRI